MPARTSPAGGRINNMYETALDKLADGIIRMMYSGYDESLI
jgi:hypothetical protein